MRGTVLFGGTFDPFHNGHLRILKHLQTLPYQIVIIPNDVPPYKPHASAPLADRVAMVAKVLETYGIQAIISDPAPSYFVETLRKLLKSSLPRPFFLAIGSDSHSQFYSWKNYHEILDHVSLLVIDRDSISSTSIREKLTQGDDISDLVPACVFQYIRDNKLYV